MPEHHGRFGVDGDLPVWATGDIEPFKLELSGRSLGPGRLIVSVRLTADAPATPPRFSIHTEIPCVDMHATWTVEQEGNRQLKPVWLGKVEAMATSRAPVICVHNAADRNRITFACGDTVEPIELVAGVREEDAALPCTVRFFTKPHAPIRSYEAEVMIDRRDVPYWRAIAEVADWWAEDDRNRPCRVPEAARLPVYSTWYSYHQVFTDRELEDECRLAKRIGCESVIVDDGWQTADVQRGYAYTGDWEPEPGKVPDMAAHVKRVHDLGMKYLLWYSVPFVGVHSDAYRRFEDKLLVYHERYQAGILDPRFPECREYLIQAYETAVRDWGLDGLKLDFVNDFTPTQEAAARTGEGRDIASVPAATVRLLTDISDRLTQIDPEIMIEFRQVYVGPTMRRYGNMFRAGDCPKDAITNRVRTLDIRLLCGDTAAHADMMMWHRDEPVEVAAQQLLHTIFAVPQVSMRLAELPEPHLRMLKYQLAWWRARRHVLLDGALEPLSQEQGYPLVRAHAGDEQIVAAYADRVVTLSPDAPPPRRLTLVNATPRDRLVLDLDRRLGDAAAVTRDCAGGVTAEAGVTLDPGPRRVAVPPSGTVEFDISR